MPHTQNSMESKEIIIYPAILKEIHLFQSENKKAKNILLNSPTKKRLVEETCFRTKSTNILSVDKLLGLKIEIDDSLYDNEVKIT